MKSLASDRHFHHHFKTVSEVIQQLKKLAFLKGNVSCTYITGGTRSCCGPWDGLRRRASVVWCEEGLDAL